MGRNRLKLSFTGLASGLRTAKDDRNVAKGSLQVLHGWASFWASSLQIFHACNNHLRMSRRALVADFVGKQFIVLVAAFLAGPSFRHCPAWVCAAEPGRAGEGEGDKE